MQSRVVVGLVLRLRLLRLLGDFAKSFVEALLVVVCFDLTGGLLELFDLRLLSHDVYPFDAALSPLF